MGFIRLVDTMGYVYMVNVNHIVALEYATIDDFSNTKVDTNRIVVSLSNGEAITIPKEQAEAICGTSTL
ncbi:MAG: hypothetical protein IKR19_07560 [Acholeplasmatales bacterium]|nr:hypothetical protein [Acholeplasmatales bacterium]